MGASDHKQQAGNRPITLGIVTVSDTRTPETDVNKTYLEAKIAESGHLVGAYRLIQDEPHQVHAVLEALADIASLQVILLNGGTGISRRDTTYDVVSRLLEKTLPGFGELFRMISYEQVGASAMLSRAVAGVYRQKFVACLPGSPNAVQTAFERLILPELNHLAWELTR